jgi:hypothetical protein
MLTACRFDVVNSTKKERFTKVLVQKRTQLLILQSITGEARGPMIRIDNARGWHWPYASNLAAKATKCTPLLSWKPVSLSVKRDTGDGCGIIVGLNIRSDPKKNLGPLSECINEHRF